MTRLMLSYQPLLRNTWRRSSLGDSVPSETIHPTAQRNFSAFTCELNGREVNSFTIGNTGLEMLQNILPFHPNFNLSDRKTSAF